MVSSAKLEAFAFLVLRLVIAIIFLYAGYAKLMFWNAAPAEMPAMMVRLMQFLSIVEPLGAIALILGYLTRWAAAGLAIIMVGAIVIMGSMGSPFFTMPQMSGLDYLFMIFAGCLVIAACGGGKYAVDAVRG